MAPLDPATAVSPKHRTALLQHGFDKASTIGTDRGVDEPFQFSQLRGINIDDRLVGSPRKLPGIPTHEWGIEASPDYEDEIGIL
jgi:hypothetical protein